MAVEAGAKVIGTTRNLDRSGKLEDLGAHRLEVEGPDLSTRIAEAKHIDAVLDLVGNSTRSPRDGSPAEAMAPRKFDGVGTTGLR
jgi:NADPH:quinone reductase-like Zn-dependent oxidoreductase